MNQVVNPPGQPADDPVGTADRAKAALRHLAERRLAPTPANYEAAWRLIGGGSTAAAPTITRGADEGRRGLLAQLFDHLGRQRVLTMAQLADLRQAVDRDDWTAADASLREALGAWAAPNWSTMLQSVLMGFLTQHRGWTQARKRESLTRVIDGAGRRDDVLHMRLGKLVDSWTREPLDETPEPVSADGQAALPVMSPDSLFASGFNAPEALRQQRNEKMIAEMSNLLSTLCESLAGVSKETGWIREQADRLRSSLGSADDFRTLAGIREIIAESGQAQRKITAQRLATLDEVKRMIGVWIASIGQMSESTDAFGDRLGHYSESIARIESVEQLSATVASMLDDTRQMGERFEQSRHDILAARSRALTLESEVSRLEEELALVSTQILIDDLTGVMNRRGLVKAFKGAHDLALDNASPLGLSLIDLDNFKQVNEDFGHHGGDDALREFVRWLKRHLRPTDALARFGGEEFVLLLPDMDQDAAVAHVEGLLRDLAQHRFLIAGQPLPLSFSAGVTTVGRRDTLVEAVERADLGTHTAKLAGKNCVRATSGPA